MILNFVNAALIRRCFVDEAGSQIDFDSSWIGNGDNASTASNVTYSVAERVIVDSSNNAINGVFTNSNNTLTYNGATYTLNINSDGLDSYLKDGNPSNQLYFYKSVETPALKVEQFEAGTASD